MGGRGEGGGKGQPRRNVEDGAIGSNGTGNGWMVPFEKQRFTSG